jgi:hypothetical protein
MKYVNASDTTHNIKLILRKETDEAGLVLYNEFTQVTENIDSTFINNDGISIFTFNYDFKAGDSFQFKLEFQDKIYYRGKIKAI